MLNRRARRAQAPQVQAFRCFTLLESWCRYSVVKKEREGDEGKKTQGEPGHSRDTHGAHGRRRAHGSHKRTSQPRAELRAVLGGFGGLGALLPLLERAQIRSLSMLRQLSVEELRTRLNEVSGSPLSLAYLDRLPVLGLCKA